MHIRQKDDVPVLGCISPCVKTSHSLKTYTIKKKKTFFCNEEHCFDRFFVSSAEDHKNAVLTCRQKTSKQTRHVAVWASLVAR